MTKERKELILSVIVEDDKLMKMLVRGECEELCSLLNEHGFICTEKEIQNFHQWICEIKKKYDMSDKELSESILDKIVGGFSSYAVLLIRKMLIGIGCRQFLYS